MKLKSIVGWGFLVSQLFSAYVAHAAVYAKPEIGQPGIATTEDRDYNGEESELDVIDSFQNGTTDQTSPPREAAKKTAAPGKVLIRVTVGRDYDWQDCSVTVSIDGAPIKELTHAVCRSGDRLLSELHPGYVGPTPHGSFSALKYGSEFSDKMKYAVYFKESYAIHRGNLNTGSHGCIRVSESSAFLIWNTVHKYKLANTSFDIVRHPALPKPAKPPGVKILAQH